MSTITQTGSYAKYLGLVRNLTGGQQKVDDLSRQLTTGKKSVDLNAYGAETQKLLELRAELVQRTNYVQNIDTALPRVKASDTVLNSLEKLATDWQGSNLMPFEPGPPSVTTPYNANADAMTVTVNHNKSSFMQNARYTVTAVPSQTGANGTYDITVADGLGGRATRSINLKTIPPDDGGGYNFAITGGPGEGAVMNLNFDKLQSASYSTFDVSWPQADQMRDRVEGAMRDIRQYLNERFGDRYLFSGSRYATEPVSDLMAGRQTSKVTFNGAIVEPDDYFEVTIDGQVFGYQVQPGDPRTLTFVAGTLNSMINAAPTKLPMTVSTANGILTLIGDEPNQTFEVSARVLNSTTVENTVTVPATTQAAVAPDPLAIPPVVGAQQIDHFSLNGTNVDIGDTFEFTVAVGDPDDINNQKYYNMYPDEPKDLPPYQTYTVRYTVTEQDYYATAPNDVTTVDKVADKLRQAFAALYPAPPVSIDPIGSGAGIDLTSNAMGDPNHPNRSQLFSTKASVTNSAVKNTVTVATLPPEAEPIIDTPYAEPPDLPYYDTEYLTKRKNSNAWDKAKVTAEDGLAITYGISSDDKAFQTLIAAFRMARVASANPGKYEEYSTKSRELMAQAKDQVRSVHAKVASDLATLEQKKTSHEEAMTLATERIAKIEGIDETEVAARLRASMTALEAAYTVAGQTQKLSLLNYIA